MEVFLLKKIALVDDDINIQSSVSMALEEQGYEISCYNDGLSGLKGIVDNPPDLAILDIKMPRMDGIELLKKLKEKMQIPVIMLTSKTQEEDQLLGFNNGADDYVTKPFSLQLLQARIKTLLKRVDLKLSPQKEENILIRGDLKLNLDRHECFWQKKEIKLTLTEFLILSNLAEHPGHIKTRESLIDAAYGESIYIEDRSIDTHIKRLRKKIKTASEDFDKIETLYGMGYKYKE